MQMNRIAVFLLAIAPLCPGAPPVSFTQEPGRINVVIEGQPFGTLYCAPQQDKPFLFPLRSAAGVSVVRGWPIEPEPGDSRDHPHQRGLWWAHGATNGVDFWTNGEKTGRYELKSGPKVDSKTGTIRVELDMTTPAKNVIGSLIEEYTFAAEGSNRIVDFYVQILADRGQVITLGDTKEGVLGIRVCEELNESRGTTLLNSEGGVGEKAIWGKRARWVDYSGKVKGTAVGVAMFDHPSNPNFPTYWMARGYGLLAANAFGARDFSGDKTLDGSMLVAAGGEMEFHHRLIIHSGDAKAAGIEALYKQWAAGKFAPR